MSTRSHSCRCHRQIRPRVSAIASLGAQITLVSAVVTPASRWCVLDDWASDTWRASAVLNKEESTNFIPFRVGEIEPVSTALKMILKICNKLVICDVSKTINGSLDISYKEFLTHFLWLVTLLPCRIRNNTSFAVNAAQHNT